MTVFDTYESGLPGAFFTGDGALAGEKVLVHTNSAGASRKFPRYQNGQNVHFSVSSAVPVGRVHIIDRIDDKKKWQLALDQSGNNCSDAWVIKATEIIPLQDYPPGTILFLRAEPLHPGAHPTLLDIDGHRITAFLTNSPAGAARSWTPVSVPAAGARTGSRP